MKRLALAAVAVILLAALGVWWFSPTQVLKRRTRSLLSTLTMDAGTGRVTRHAGAYSLDRLLAPKVTLETPTIGEANGTFDRDELGSAYSWLCDQAKQTKFELGEIQSLKIDGNSAEMRVRLEGMVELAAYRPVDGTFDVTFEWRKEDDGWRLVSARWDQVP